jgi:hypothetical protein
MVRAGVGREMVKIFDAAKRFIMLLEFAEQRKYEETVAALAALSRSSIEVIRPLMQSLRDDEYWSPAGWLALAGDRDCNSGKPLYCGFDEAPELERAKSQYSRMNIDDAGRLLRFWQIRSTISPSSINKPTLPPTSC